MAGMIPFAQSSKTGRTSELLDELFMNVLFDEEPLFISDEATIWDVSMASLDDLLKRLSEHYGVSVSEDDLRAPLWKLVSELDKKRNTLG
jgi:hypothetical protein